MTASRRRLILTRHAKSSWVDPCTPDHARPLNRHGVRAALELGEWLQSRGYLPEEVACSDSLRTTETWAGIVRAPLEVLPHVTVTHELYLASADLLMKTVHGFEHDTAMILAHNPGIAELALRLLAELPLSADLRRFPSGATLVVDFFAPSWAEVAPHSGSLRDSFLPAGNG